MTKTLETQALWSDVFSLKQTQELFLALSLAGRFIKALSFSVRAIESYREIGTTIVYFTPIIPLSGSQAH